MSDREFVIDELLRDAESQPIAVVPEKANDQHYEVPAGFFQSVLGPRMKYSCCFWDTNTDSLEHAETEALNRTCAAADLRDGMDVLELGCGWGSLSLWMAEHYPNCRITAVSNAGSQRQFIQRLAGERRLSNLEVITSDINDFQPRRRFDRVLSVEMFEHIRNHRRLLDRIDDWLRPTGRLFVHLFCHRDTPYVFRSDRQQDWMGRHFFTGGMMPSADLLERCGSAMKLISQSEWNGRHYARTCRAWLDRLDQNRNSLEPILAAAYGASEADRWHHRWRLFFMACEELFAYDDGDEWFVSHYLFERSADH